MRAGDTNSDANSACLGGQKHGDWQPVVLI